MASAGTLLSDLDGKAPVVSKDDDLVNKILADMNMPSSSNPIMSPSGNGNRMISSPNPNTTYPMSTDPSMATAHMIGKEYPTTADFANLMHAPSYSHGGSSFASVAPPMQHATPTLVESSGNFYSELMTQLKQPLLVSIIIFLVSLPVLNVLI